MADRRGQKREPSEIDASLVEVLDPRASHRQFRCRRCGATWRPARRTDGRLAPSDKKCWRGCTND